MDSQVLLILLAREAGYLRTSDACFKLGVKADRLLQLRRQALESITGNKPLPPLAKKD